MDSFDIETTSRRHADTKDEEEKARLLRNDTEEEEEEHSHHEEEERGLHFSKAIVLCCILTIASCSSSILAQLSKHGESGQYGYHTSTVPVLSEFTKLVISVGIVGYDYTQTGSIHAPLWTVKEFCTKYLVIGFLYAIQNNLVFIALIYLDPGTMEVLGNLKMPLTAILMCLVLHKVFSSIQILGLALLTIGAMLSKVNLVSCGEGPDKDCSKSRIGILIMIIMCCISSSASVANEYLLKHKDNGPLFWQNAQLYLSTCFFSVLHAAFIDQVPMNGDFFEGYSWMTLAVILNLALVGIIVSITLKHADNIVHAIASILAMILATVFSVLAMDAELHILSVFGFACIAVGVLLYFFSNACNMHCLASFYPASSVRSLV